jgi:hypothetical protein
VQVSTITGQIWDLRASSARTALTCGLIGCPEISKPHHTQAHAAEFVKKEMGYCVPGNINNRNTPFVTC